MSFAVNVQFTALFNCQRAVLQRTLNLVDYAYQEYLNFYFSGGGERARTDDLRLAKPALSQLSYTPGK
jgi:hypothetical protein